MSRVSVICGIVKNEQRYVHEWALHHLDIGFDKVYVYEDYGSGSHREQLEDLIKDGRVVLTPLSGSGIPVYSNRGTRVQFRLYKWFLQQCKAGSVHADWIGFFDIDEFLMFEDGYDLGRLEDEYAGKGGVLLSWKLFGANGHIERPEGGVVENYTSHLPEGTLLDGGLQWNHKSLVNVSVCKGIHSIHSFEGCEHTDGNADYVNGRQTYGKAWINHYHSKSWEDYKERIFERGNMHNNYRSLDKFFRASPEFLPYKRMMIEAERYRHANATMWISRDLRIISGGNELRLAEIQAKVNGMG